MRQKIPIEEISFNWLTLYDNITYELWEIDSELFQLIWFCRSSHTLQKPYEPIAAFWISLCTKVIRETNVANFCSYFPNVFVIFISIYKIIVFSQNDRINTKNKEYFKHFLCENVVSIRLCLSGQGNGSQHCISSTYWLECIFAIERTKWGRSNIASLKRYGYPPRNMLSMELDWKKCFGTTFTEFKSIGFLFMLATLSMYCEHTSKYLSFNLNSTPVSS